VKTDYNGGLTPNEEPKMKMIAAMMLAAAFLIAQPAFAAVVVGADGKAQAPAHTKVAKKDKSKKDDKAGDKTDEKAAAPKTDEPKKEEKKADKGGW
jgi:hypothetical protein